MFSKDDIQIVADKAKVFSKEWWAEFRRNSVWFQLRVGVVLAYLVIVGLTLVIAPPPDPDYRLVVDSLPWGTGQRTYIDVENKKLGTLKNVVIEVEGTVTEFDGKKRSGPWSKTVSRLGAGDIERVWPEDLLDRGNKPASSDLAVSRVRVWEADDPGDVLIDDVPQQKPSKADKKKKD